jgi:hypothetical protein
MVLAQCIFTGSFRDSGLLKMLWQTGQESWGCPPNKDGKFVAMFYWTWHQGHDERLSGAYTSPE